MSATIRLKVLAALSITLLTSATVWAHAGFRAKDVDPLYPERMYKEGITADLTLIPAHGCSDDTGKGYATEHVYALFPNNLDLTGITFSASDTDRYAGNALMGIRPAVNPSFRKVERIRGTVPEFFDHGPKTEDVRALRWLGGYIPDDMYAELHFRASLPRLSGCVERLRVYVPTIQYCKGGLVSAWLREATPAFPESVISPGYAPSFEILRDYDNNPLPPECTSGETREAYPSASDIDAFLTRR